MKPVVATLGLDAPAGDDADDARTLNDRSDNDAATEGWRFNGDSTRIPTEVHGTPTDVGTIIIRPHRFGRWRLGHDIGAVDNTRPI